MKTEQREIKKYKIIIELIENKHIEISLNSIMDLDDLIGDYYHRCHEEKFIEVQNGSESILINLDSIIIIKFVQLLDFEIALG